MVDAFRIVGMIGLLGWPSLPVGAAKRLGPPSDVLTAAENRTAAVRALEIGEDDVLFARVADLHGETPETIRVRTGKALRERIVPGEGYVLGYTVLRRDVRRAPVYELDPDGPRVIEVPAVGPALFEDSTAVRRLVRSAGGDVESAPEAILASIVEQVQRSDGVTRRMVLAELMLRSNLVGRADRSDRDVFRRLLESGELDPVGTDYLLRALGPLAAEGRLPWLRPILLDILASYDRQLDLRSMVPALLETTLDCLAEVGRVEDAPLLVEHLFSNNPGVGREAFAALRTLDPELAIRAATEALEAGGVHPDVARDLLRSLEGAH